MGSGPVGYSLPLFIRWRVETVGGQSFLRPHLPAISALLARLSLSSYNPIYHTPFAFHGCLGIAGSLSAGPSDNCLPIPSQAASNHTRRSPLPSPNKSRQGPPQIPPSLPLTKSTPGPAHFISLLPLASNISICAPAPQHLLVKLLLPRGVTSSSASR